MVMLSLPRIFGDAPVAYLTPPSLCATGVGHLDTSDLVWGSGQVIWTCTGMNKTLSPFTSVPVMDEIAGVNTASLGGHFHIWKTRAGGFHDELNGHVFDLERDGFRQVVLCT